MHTSILTALTLATTAVAAPTNLLQKRRTTNPFIIRAEASPTYTNWSLTNAHIAAGQNALYLQAPTNNNTTTSAPDPAYLVGEDEAFYTNQLRVAFNLTGASTPYELRLPTAANGEVGQVFSEPGEGSATFSFGGNNILETAGGFSEGPYLVPLHALLRAWHQRESVQPADTASNA